MCNWSPRKERKPSGKKFIEGKMVINFPNLVKNNLQIQETQQTPSWINTKAATPKHITVTCRNRNTAPEKHTARVSEHYEHLPTLHLKRRRPGDNGVIFLLC